MREKSKKIFINKNKKKNTLRKQWTRNIMIFIGVLFLCFGLFLYKIINTATNQILNISLKSTASFISRELSQYDIRSVLDNPENKADEYNRLLDYIEDISSRADNIFSNVYLISKDTLGNNIYIMDDSKNSYINSRDITSNEYINLAYSEKEVQILRMETDVLNQKSYITTFIPIEVENEILAILGIDMNTEILTKLQTKFISFLIIIMIISLILIWQIVKIITRRQSRSIEKLVSKMDELKKLDGDLTKRIEIYENNEIGLLADVTNEMLDTIQNILLQVSDNSKGLVENTNYFRNSFKGTKSSFEEMEKNIYEIEEKIQNQENKIFNISRSAEEVYKNINQIADFSQEVSREAMETDKNAREGNFAIENMTNQMKRFDTMMKTTISSMSSLLENSKKINIIAETITSISKQTNLLALNANIEAARAGEAGKGFSVVAEEIMKLADASSNSAREISNLLEEIGLGIENTSSSIEIIQEGNKKNNEEVNNVVLKFNLIKDSIEKVSEMVENVSGSTEEISAVMGLISEEIITVKDISRENTSNISYFEENLKMEGHGLNKLMGLIIQMENEAVTLNNNLNKLKM